MKTSLSGFLSAIAFMAIMFYGCSKSADLSGGGLQSSDLPSSGKHVYGLLTMTPDQYMNIPLYSKEEGLSKLVEKGITLVPSFSLITPPVRDQGQIGSCTAFCGSESFEILRAYKANANATSWTSTEILSPAFLYYCERVLILRQRITADNGASMVNIPQALVKYGDCLESLYVYPTSNTSTQYKTAPTSAVMTEGLTRKVVTYSALAKGDLVAVKTALLNKQPVMMGFNVYDTSGYTLFEGLNKTSNVYNPLTTSGALVSGAKLLGGHAVPIVGYDDAMLGGAGAFLVQNSWGTSWGLNGYFYLPYSVYTSTKIVQSGGVLTMSL